MNKITKKKTRVWQIIYEGEFFTEDFKGDQCDLTVLNSARGCIRGQRDWLEKEIRRLT